MRSSRACWRGTGSSGQCCLCLMGRTRPVARPVTRSRSSIGRLSMCRRTSGSRASNSFDTFSSDSSESHSSAPPPGPERRSGPRCSPPRPARVFTHHFVCLLVFPLFDCCLFLSNRGLCLYGNERGGSQRAELFDAGPAAMRCRKASPRSDAAKRRREPSSSGAGTGSRGVGLQRGQSSLW